MAEQIQAQAQDLIETINAVERDGLRVEIDLDAVQTSSIDGRHQEYQLHLSITRPVYSTEEAGLL